MIRRTSFALDAGGEIFLILTDIGFPDQTFGF
jgi:hypothetical protein